MTDGEVRGVEEPRKHRLFLIRHGETVDNVAGLYAGIRDSPLTNHGLQQASRLGKWFATNGIVFTHIFSSDLTRARITAETISAENVRQTKDDGRSRSMTVVQIQDLREQDFGYYEGKSFQARTEGTRKSGKDTHREQHKDDPGFQDVESKDSMALRADRFLDNHLFPALDSEESRTIAVVSHGMLLSTLWRCILRRQSPNTVTLTNDFIGDSRPVSLEHLGGWSNTGFLELELASRPPLEVIGDGDQTTSISAVAAAEAVAGEAQNSNSSYSETLEVRKDDTLIPNVAASNRPSKLRTAGHHTMTIKTINGKDHLKGLKRTGGGVGSSTYDQSQKTIGHFFKKQKR